MKHKFIGLFLILCILFLPSAFLLPSQISKISIVTNLGLDRVGDQIEVSLQMIEPKFETGVAKNMVVVTTQANSFKEALLELENNLGKTLAFAHLNSILCSTALLDTTPLNTILQPFVNEYAYNRNAVLLNTNDTAKSILELVNMEYTTYSTALNQTINVNANQKNTLQNFLLQQEDNLFILPSISYHTSSQMLENNETIHILKNGQLQTSFTKEEWQDILLFLHPTGLEMTFNELGQEDSFGNIQVKIKNVLSTKNTAFKTMPQLWMNSYATIEVSPTMNAQNFNFTTELEQKISYAIRLKIANGWNLLKQNQVDLLSLYRLFEFKHKRDFTIYLNSLSESENYLQNMELYYQLRIRMKHKIMLA